MAAAGATRCRSRPSRSTRAPGRLLVLLHEVGHATGAYGDHSDAQVAEINRQIFERCIR